MEYSLFEDIEVLLEAAGHFAGNLFAEWELID